MAYGTALSIDEMFADSPGNFALKETLSILSNYRENLKKDIPESQKRYFSSPEEKREFE